MTEQIMNTSALPAFLITKFNTDRVRVREDSSAVIIEPEQEVEYRCPLRGIAKGGTLTVDKLLELKRAEKELEEANDYRLHS
jgi:predicted subunit of tRNA(5-methylaminomethyl-2-thiouridylate) methyltransferase